MSSLVTRIPTAIFAPVAGPSRLTASHAYRRGFGSAAKLKQAIVADDMPNGPESSVVVVPLRAPEDTGANKGFFATPRTSLPSRLPRSRFLLKISAPVPTTSLDPRAPQALVHDASRDLYFTYRPRMEDAAERDAFRRLMASVREEGGFARVFWAGAGEPGLLATQPGGTEKAIKVFLEEQVEPKAVEEAQF